MDNLVIKDLNTVLKGEHMAVEAYEKFIAAVGHRDLKEAFEEIRKDHEVHTQQLSEHIERLGGKPEKGTGMAGVMANVKLTLDTIRPDDESILKKAYDGEDKGIAAVENILGSEWDEDSRQLVNGMLEKDHAHLHTMAEMISRYEIH